MRTMMRRIAILLLAAMMAQADDNSTMHIMEGPSTLSPSSACKNFTCTTNEECILKEVVCVKAPCNPVPTCVPRGPSCMTMKCAANTTCVDLPTGSVCQPIGSNSTIDPCATMKCANGTICKLQTVNCLLPPCSPLAQCVSPSTGPSCMTIKCAANTTCVDLPTRSVCQPIDNSSNPCASMLCSVGTVCEVKTVNCIRAPCPPIGECVPRTTNSSSCLHIKCSSGFECRNGDKGEGCYPISEPQPDLCANFTCPSNQTCAVLVVNCLVAPCPAPKPYCTPSKGGNACNLAECNKGFFCVPVRGEAKCLRASGASCASTSCAVNTTCIDFKEGAVCIEGIVGGGCANMTCGGKSQCKETLDGPRCFRGGKRDDRILDAHGCGRGEQHTECMPQCEETCRGTDTCDLSIPTASNSSIWTNSTSDNSTSLPSHCVSGCICRDHFKRNVQGNCVPNKRCWLTPGCRENESWSRCRGCEPTCSNPSGAQICAAVCQSGCACDEGFVRSKRGMCVLPEDCRAVDLINGDHGNQTIAIEG